MDGFGELEESPVPAVQFERIPIAGRDDHGSPSMSKSTRLKRFAGSFAGGGHGLLDLCEGQRQPVRRIPAIRPDFPAAQAPKVRSRSNGKNGRSCSPS